MSLDFVVLAPDGLPEKSLSLDLSLHHELAIAAGASGLTHLKRLRNYYEDAEISANDLPDLLDEIRALRGQVDILRLVGFLNSLETLVGYTLNVNRSLHILAD